MEGVRPVEWIAVSSLLSALIGAPRTLPVTLASEWEVRVEAGTVEIAGRTIEVSAPVTLRLEPTEMISVSDEEIDGLPVFSPGAAGYCQGRSLAGVRTYETSAAGALDPASLRVKSGPGEAPAFTLGTDYALGPVWGVVGRIEGGAIAEGQHVWADYRHGMARLDSIVVDTEGRVSLLAGTPHINCPRPPELPEGTFRLASVFVPVRCEGLTEDCLYPVLEDAFPPEPAAEGLSAAERLIPRAMAKIRSGEKLRILAWGDSVTDGLYVKDFPAQRWQEQFVAQLRERFPGADIELTTLGWGGRTVASFLAEPPGSPYNYAEQVLGRRPDLIVSEFVNDAYLDPAGVEAEYGKLLADFQGIGAEWVLLTPHYVRMDWMGLSSQHECDADPRPYVAGLREFTERHGLALADASLRWGRLWRQGIPYETFETNSINHPDERGMKLFADALLALFPAE
jgi:hypothetical protein